MDSNVEKQKLKLFIFFLKINGRFSVVDNFLKNAKINIKESMTISRFKNVNINLFLDMAFCWEDTEEGHMFWRKIDEEWRRFCTNLRTAKQ